MCWVPFADDVHVEPAELADRVVDQACAASAVPAGTASAKAVPPTSLIDLTAASATVVSTS